MIVSTSSFSRLMLSTRLVLFGLRRIGRRRVGLSRRIEGVRFDQNLFLGQVSHDQPVIVIAALRAVAAR